MVFFVMKKSIKIFEFDDDEVSGLVEKLKEWGFEIGGAWPKEWVYHTNNPSIKPGVILGRFKVYCGVKELHVLAIDDNPLEKIMSKYYLIKQTQPVL